MNDSTILSLVRFGHVLRRKGVPIGPERIRVFCEAAAAIAPVDLYWAGRASLLWRPDQIPIYDDVFQHFFGDVPESADLDESVQAVARPRARSADVDDEAESESAAGTASRREILQQKSFELCTEDDWAELAILLRALPSVLPVQRIRRYQRGRHGPIDIRRVLRRAAATAGDPISIRERHRRLSVRPLVFLVDISGSMAAYTRGHLMFAHAVAQSTGKVEVYAFGTRLTDLTGALATKVIRRSPPREASSTVPDWEGGTRIGDALSAFLDERRNQSDTRRAVAFVCSDGLDTGDPDVLARETARLRRTVHRLVWLNPLKADPRYEPLTRGMRAVRPHLDLFESGHNLASLLSVLEATSGSTVVPSPR